MPSNIWVLVFLKLIASVIEAQEIKPEILIIGAGAAGIAAASKLHQHDFPVRILEAESRLGGRIHSVQLSKDSYLDLGAEYLLDKNNSIYELFKNDNFFHEFEANNTFLKSDRTSVDAEVCTEILEVYANLMLPSNMAHDAFEDLSIGLYFMLAYNLSIYELYGKQPEKYRFAFECLPTFEKMITSDAGSATWYDTSLKTDYVDDETLLHSNGKGLQTILTRMLTKGPQLDRFTLKTTIKNINYEYDDKFVQVLCTDGSTYTAQHIIFTPSLGVLKKQRKTMFQPKLDADKVKAIQTLGYGNVVKVLVQFDKPWWQMDIYFSLVWTYADLQMIIFEYENATNFSTRESWLRDLLGMYPQPGVPNVMSFIFTGKHTKRIEKVSDAALQDGIMFLLYKFAAHLYNISRPVMIFRDNWYQNEHFRGTYTYETIYSRLFQSRKKLSAMDTLGIPIYKSNVPRILFAGEATHPTRYGTLDGAIATGYREADRLIKFYDHKKN